MKRHIIAVTGIRSEYFLLAPVLKAIASHPALRLGLVVTGAHLSRRHGYTINEIKKDGYRISETIRNLPPGDKAEDRVKGMAAQLSKLASRLKGHRPDILLVVGDREEAMNTAILGQYLNIPVAHISGGDRCTGNVDDQIRHAVTKLAHIHLATNAQSARRILNLGEQRFRVFNVGNPGLDRFVSVPKIKREEVFRYFGFPGRAAAGPLVLVIQHPLSSEMRQSYRQMKETMEAVRTLKINAVVVYPNSDPGSRAMIDCIEEYRAEPQIRIFRNLPDIHFVNTFRQASCLVGNSSAGVLESALLKLPVVNVGNRQRGRLNAGNVLFVDHDRGKIIRAIRRSVFDKHYITRLKKCRNPYGNGKTGWTIAGILARIPIDQRLLVKDMTY